MKRLTAREVMSAPVITVGPETAVADMARVLTERKISGVPVVDNEGNLVGIVTEGDLLFKETGPGGLPKLAFFLPARTREIQEQVRRYAGRVAADVMTREVVTAAETTPVRELAARMARHSINRIPIVKESRVVGIVSRNDVLKGFLRTDEDLAELARATIIQDLWLDPKPLRIEVRNGVVSISGEVDRRSDAHLIETFVAGIDGVVGVDVSGLRYEVDDHYWPPRLGTVQSAM